MINLIISILTQSLTFLPLAFAISTSYHILRATDMTLDGSFVIGAAVFARLVTLGISPLLAAMIAIMCGGLTGMLTATIQRGGRVDPLLAGVLATFILGSLNLLIMGKPNISLLTQQTLVSSAFNHSDAAGWGLVSIYILVFCGLAITVLTSRFGLSLRALGDNPHLLARLGRNIELHRLSGFAFTNMLAAAAGCFTAQTVGYADIGMGLGMTLTGVGAIILGRHIFSYFSKKPYLRTGAEFMSCLIGVLVYFMSLNVLLRLDIDPIYLKMILGFFIIFFLRSALNPQHAGTAS